MQLVATGAVRRGRHRLECQDRVLVDEALGLFVVADAFVHARAAEVTLETLRATVLQAYRSGASDLAGMLSGGIRAADSLVARLGAEPRYAGMGATAVATLVRGAEAFVAVVPGTHILELGHGGVVDLMPESTPFDQRPPAEPARRRQSEPSVPDPPIGSGEAAVTERRYVLTGGERWLMHSDGVADAMVHAIVEGGDRPRFEKAELERVVERVLADPFGDDCAAVCLAIGSRPATTGHRVPARLLQDVRYDLPTGAEPGLSATEVERTPSPAWVRQEVERVDPGRAARLGRLTTPAREVRVVFDAQDPASGEWTSLQVMLTASHWAGFTELDLLHALDCAMTARLAETGCRLGDRRGLAGLVLQEPVPRDAPPVYRVVRG